MRTHDRRIHGHVPVDQSMCRSEANRSRSSIASSRSSLDGRRGLMVGMLRPRREDLHPFRSLARRRIVLGYLLVWFRTPSRQTLGGSVGQALTGRLRALERLHPETSDCIDAVGAGLHGLVARFADRRRPTFRLDYLARCLGGYRLRCSNETDPDPARETRTRMIASWPHRTFPSPRCSPSQTTRTC